MDLYGWIQLALYIWSSPADTKPLGLYLVRVLDAEGKTFLDPALSRWNGCFTVSSVWTRKRSRIGSSTPFPCSLSASWGYFSPMPFSGFSISCL